MDVSVGSDGATGAVVMRVDGEVDVVTSALLRDKLAMHMGSGTRDLVVDLTAVTFMDSTGLGVLVRAARQVRERGGRLELVVDQSRVVNLLRLTAVTQYLRIHRTVTEAVAALQDDT